MQRVRFASRSTVPSAAAVVLILAAVGSIAYAGTVLKDRGDTPRKSFTNRPGSDYKQIPMDTPPTGAFDTRSIDCENACLHDEKCLSWTYVMPGTIQGPQGNCWLKDKLVLAVKDPNCISGSIGVTGRFRDGGEYKHLEHNADGSPINAHQCYATCLSEDPCLSWTYTTASFGGVLRPTCRLKNEVGPVKIERDVISGWFVRKSF